MTVDKLDVPPAWSDLPPWILKYVDNVNAGERHFLRNAVSTFSQTTERKDLHAKEFQEILNKIKSNAETLGMQVNERKTQLLYVFPAIHSEVSSHIILKDGTQIASQDRMVLLGFAFGNRPNLDTHMDLISKKFNIRVWVVRHLKQSGVPDKDIAAVFASTIRLVIEYACPVYAPMLTGTQAETIERMQRRVLKIIYGHRTSYRAAMEKSGLPTMEQRRIEICERFTNKTSSTEQWKDWYPPTPWPNIT